MSTANQKHLREAGAIGLIVQVLDIHKDNAEVLIHGVEAVGALAMDKINRGLLVDEAAQSKIMDLMCQYSTNDDVMYSCINALVALSQKDAVVIQE
jgi:hypothetical protein